MRTLEYITERHNYRGIGNTYTRNYWSEESDQFEVELARVRKSTLPYQVRSETGEVLESGGNQRFFTQEENARHNRAFW